jgi:hypothetical protein
MRRTKQKELHLPRGKALDSPLAAKRVEPDGWTG